MKKLVFAILAGLSINSFAVVGDNGLSSAPDTAYNKFKKELKQFKFNSYILTSVKFYNQKGNNINSFNNIDSVDATVGLSNGSYVSDTINMSYYSYRDDFGKMHNNMVYDRYENQPIGGYLQDSDINSDAISSLYEKIKTVAPKYTGKLKSVTVDKSITNGLMYSYSTQRSNLCYYVTYNVTKDAISNIAEIDCQ